MSGAAALVSLAARASSCSRARAWACARRALCVASTSASVWAAWARSVSAPAGERAVAAEGDQDALVERAGDQRRRPARRARPAPRRCGIGGLVRLVVVDAQRAARAARPVSTRASAAIGMSPECGVARLDAVGVPQHEVGVPAAPDAQPGAVGGHQDAGRAGRDRGDLVRRRRAHGPGPRSGTARRSGRRRTLVPVSPERGACLSRRGAQYPAAPYDRPPDGAPGPVGGAPAPRQAGPARRRRLRSLHPRAAGQRRSRRRRPPRSAWIARRRRRERHRRAGAGAAAVGVERGEEVICPSYTFYATAEAIAAVGAVPCSRASPPTTTSIRPQSTRRSRPGRAPCRRPPVRPPG